MAKRKDAISIDRIKQLALLAGFEYSHEGKSKTATDHDYVVFSHERTNSYKVLFDTDNNEEQFLKKLFEACKQAGRIQVRQELSDIINRVNYE